MGILIIWNPISRLDGGEHVAFPILDFMMHRRQKRCKPGKLGTRLLREYARLSINSKFLVTVEFNAFRDIIF